MKIKTLTIAAIVFATNAYAQTYQFQSNNSSWWGIPEAQVNTPGLENAFLSVLGVNSGGHHFQVIIQRDGSSREYFDFDIPTNEMRKVVNIGEELAKRGVTGEQFFTAFVFCPDRCIVSLVQRPSGPDFKSRPVYPTVHPYLWATLDAVVEK